MAPPTAAVAEGGFAGQRPGAPSRPASSGSSTTATSSPAPKAAYRAGRAAADIRKRRRARLESDPFGPCGGYRQRRCRRGKGGEARRRGSRAAAEDREAVPQKARPARNPCWQGQGRPWRQGRPPICRHRRKGCRRQLPGRGPGRVRLCQVARRPAGRRGGRRSEGRIRRKARGGRRRPLRPFWAGALAGVARLRSSEPHPLDSSLGAIAGFWQDEQDKAMIEGPSRLHHLRHGARGAGVPGGVRASRRLHHRAGHLRERPGRRHEPAGHQGQQPLRHQVGIELRQLPGGRRQGAAGPPTRRWAARSSRSWPTSPCSRATRTASGSGAGFSCRTAAMRTTRSSRRPSPTMSSDKMAEGLKDAGYATSSEYVESLKSVMEVLQPVPFRRHGRATTSGGRGRAATPSCRLPTASWACPMSGAGSTPGVGLDCSGLTQYCYAAGRA